MVSSSHALQGTARSLVGFAGQTVRSRRRYIAWQRRHQGILAGAQLAYAALFTSWLLDRHTWPAPDLVAVFLLVFAILAGRGLGFLRDWSPLVLLLLGYIGLTGLSYGFFAHPHIQFPIDADRAIFFGNLPTTVLQTHLWNAHRIGWYDYLAVLIYPMHFIVPLLLAFLLWFWQPRRYWRFVASYLLLCYAGLVTYALYPMAPPWWAADLGRIPPVASITALVQFGSTPHSIVLATRVFGINPAAAMPSIHAGTSLLIALVAWRSWPKWGWLAFVYPLIMTFAVIYLGAHYFVDLLAGWLYAAIAFCAVWVRLPRPLPFLLQGTGSEAAGIAGTEGSADGNG